MSINTIPSINTSEEFSSRRRKITEGYAIELMNINRGYSSKEVVIALKGFFLLNKMSLTSYNENLKSIYLKYDGITRRKLL